MERAEFDRLLAGHFAGDLSPADGAALEAHVAGDPAARAEFEAYGRQDAALRRGYGALRAHVDALKLPELPARVIDSRSRRRGGWIPWAVAASLLAGAALWSANAYRQNALSGPDAVARVRTLDGEAFVVAGETLRPLHVGDRLAQREHFKLAGGAYAALEIDGRNMLEVRGGSQFELLRFADRLEMNLHQGEVWAHISHKPALPLAVRTARLRAIDVGTDYGVEDALDHTTVAVAQGTVRVDAMNAIEPTTAPAGGWGTLLHAGDVYSTPGGIGGATPPMQWLRVRDALGPLEAQAMARGSGDMRAKGTLAEANRVMDAAAQTSATAARVLAQAVNAPTTTTQSRAVTLLDALPSSTTWFVHVPHWGRATADFRNSDYTQLLQEPALRVWWEKQSASPEFAKFLASSHLKEIFGMAGMLDGEVVVGGAGMQAIIAADCGAQSAAIEARLHEILAAEARRNSRGASDAQIEADVRTLGQYVRVEGGRLWMAADASQLAAAQARLAAASGGAGAESRAEARFTASEFYRRASGNAGDEEFLIAVDSTAVGEAMKRTISRGDGPAAEPATSETLHNLMLIASGFEGRAMTQAARFAFGGPRRGWGAALGEPGPMHGFEIMSPETHLAASARLASVRQVMRLIAGLEDGDSSASASQTGSRAGAQRGRRGGGSPWEESATSRVLHNVAERDELFAALGSEVSAGIDSPILPIPNVKIAFEVRDRPAAERAMAALTSDTATMLRRMGTRVSHETSMYRGAAIESLVIQGTPFMPSYAFVADRLVFGPGAQFVRNSLDVLQSGTSLATEPRFLSLLPRGGSPQFSLLIYQDILRAAAQFTQSPLAGALGGLTDGALPDLSFLQRYHAASVAFAYAYDDHIDVHLHSPDGVDLNIGAFMPLVAQWLAPQQN